MIGQYKDPYVSGFLITRESVEGAGVYSVHLKEDTELMHRPLVLLSNPSKFCKEHGALRRALSAVCSRCSSYCLDGCKSDGV